jgi:hypothetical protein
MGSMHKNKHLLLVYICLFFQMGLLTFFLVILIDFNSENNNVSQV